MLAIRSASASRFMRTPIRRDNVGRHRPHRNDRLIGEYRVEASVISRSRVTHWGNLGRRVAHPEGQTKGWALAGRVRLAVAADRSALRICGWRRRSENADRHGRLERLRGLAKARPRSSRHCRMWGSRSGRGVPAHHPSCLRQSQGAVDRYPSRGQGAASTGLAWIFQSSEVGQQ